MGSLMRTIKSCGKRHSWCKVCRPDIGPAMGRRSRGRKFSDEHKLALSRARRASTYKVPSPSAETRVKISASLKRHIAKCDGQCGSAVCSPPASPPTDLERRLYVLLAEFPTVIREQRFGRYRVDAYLPPPYHLAFEADGVYWHDRPERVKHDARRDAYLLAEYGLPVVRLGETELMGMI